MLGEEDGVNCGSYLDLKVGVDQSIAELVV